MSEAEHNNNDPSSLSSTFSKARDHISSDRYNDALPLLLEVESMSSKSSLFSTNESLIDISTSTLKYLSIDYYLALTFMNVTTNQVDGGGSSERLMNIKRAMEYYHRYLNKIDVVGDVMSDDVRREYLRLIEEEEERKNLEEDDSGGDGGRYVSGRIGLRGRENGTMMTAGQMREKKIERFRMKKAAENEIARLKALRERRDRLLSNKDDDDAEEEVMDGYDDEGLVRALSIAELARCGVDAMEEIQAAPRELEMLEMALKMERQRLSMNVNGHGGEDESRRKESGMVEGGNGTKMNITPKPTTVTHITQNNITGQLDIRREELRAGVFRPGWNQPTMTLAEYGDREVQRAMERERQQKINEKEKKLEPRRYDELVRDGMEDNEELVEASADLDRKWDNFKDENPRGSGNKMGDRGDRNF